jgi:hypothetical protein
VGQRSPRQTSNLPTGLPYQIFGIPSALHKVRKKGQAKAEPVECPGVVFFCILCALTFSLLDDEAECGSNGTGLLHNCPTPVGRLVGKIDQDAEGEVEAVLRCVMCESGPFFS